MALVLLWQFLTVHYNRGGNWTALFLIGADWRTPPDLINGAYRFPGGGFDGEMYRIVAHDLFMRRGYAPYLDVAADRYRRLLVPALAYLLVGGFQPWIDGSYIAVIAFFVFLGAYWLSRWAAIAGYRPAWALAFLLVPATVISMDRMTVDVALAAFTIAFALYWKAAAWWKVAIVLTLACLARETASLLVAGACSFELLNRRYRRMMLWAGTAVPMLTWFMFIRRLYPGKTHLGMPDWFADRIGPSLFYRMFKPQRYPLPPSLEAIARFGDSLALAAILLAAIIAIVWLLRSHPKGPLALSSLFFVALIFALSRGEYWTDVNGYARVLSPLMILVALPSVIRETSISPWWLGFASIIVMDLRLGMQFTGAIGGVVRGLLRF